MITANCMGRLGHLGNQLFQYGVACAVAAKLRVEVAIPDRLDRNHWRRTKGWVELGPFAASHVRRHSPTYEPARVYEEKHFHYDSAVFDQPDGTDFEGYFQSWRYFSSLPRETFAFLPEWSKKIQDHVDHLRAEAQARGFGRLVSVHIRRGDYLNHPDTHVVVGRDYVMAGTELFKTSLPVIFSDDPDWCRQHLPTHWLLGNTGCAWTDMGAMSRCDDNVISASTFSWWGAYINPSSTKMVVAPKQWFGPKVRHDTKDLIPPGWIQL